MPVEDAAKRCPAHGGVNPVKIFAKKFLLCVLCELESTAGGRARDKNNAW